uniref:Peptidase A1 domain-containing protein n=1 Tax=Quercus lobata TaxID=97700 RepID=A0A7N2MR71_QUELO
MEDSLFLLKFCKSAVVVSGERLGSGSRAIAEAGIGTPQNYWFSTGIGIFLKHQLLYFAKLGLRSPPKDYYVQVDTRSDILWVNCVDCKSCPKKSGLGVCASNFSFKLNFSVSLLKDGSLISWGVVLVCNIVLNLCGYILCLQFGRDSNEPSNNSLESALLICFPLFLPHPTI